MQIINLLISLMVCITVHEAAHAWTAWKLGDPTAKMAGRVSLNPIRHLDLLGTLMIFVVHFGWGKPVPFNFSNLRNPKRDAALIAVAGPIANLLTALITMLLSKYFAITGFLIPIFSSIYTLSIVLFLFNLLPISPLDGSKIIALLIPNNRMESYHRFLSQGPIILLILVFGDRLLSTVTHFSLLQNYIQVGYDITTFSLSVLT